MNPNERMKAYRSKMQASGYKSVTIFLSIPATKELKRLGDVYRLTRAESMDHIFDIYSKSNVKDESINVHQKKDACINNNKSPFVVVYKDLNSAETKIARSIIYNTIEDAKAGIDDWESDNWEVIHGPASI